MAKFKTDKIKRLRNRRGDDRLDVQWWAHLQAGDATPICSCRILNVSLAGALIEAEVDGEIGNEFIIDIDRVGQFAAEVRWTDGRKLGVRLQAGPDLKLKSYAEQIGLFSRTPVEYGPGTTGEEKAESQ